METLYYSDASLQDLAEIVSIYNSIIPGRMVTADVQPVSVEERISWFHAHNPGHRPLWVVRDKDQGMVGWVSFQNFYGRPAYNATAEISIYLHPDYRGKGLGKQILDYSMKQCRRLGINTLLGYIFAHNEPSLKLFFNAGFEEWAHLPNIAKLDGIERSVKILGKRLY